MDMSLSKPLELVMDTEAQRPAGHGVPKSRARLSDFTFTFHFHALEEDMATHSSVLASIRISAKWYLPFWFIFQNVLPAFIGSSGSGIAFFAHIGGFLVGLLAGYIYKKTHSSEFTYGTRYGWKGGGTNWGT